MVAGSPLFSIIIFQSSFACRHAWVSLDHHGSRMCVCVGRRREEVRRGSERDQGQAGEYELLHRGGLFEGTIRVEITTFAYIIIIIRFPA